MTKESEFELGEAENVGGDRDKVKRQTGINCFHFHINGAAESDGESTYNCRNVTFPSFPRTSISRPLTSIYFSFFYFLRPPSGGGSFFNLIPGARILTVYSTAQQKESDFLKFEMKAGKF